MLNQPVFPKVYDLFFDVDLEKFKFSGLEKIELNIHKPLKKIVLNSKSLDIKKVILTNSNSKQTLTPNFYLDDEKETITLLFENSLVGNFVLSIEFSGILSDDLNGFYRSKYSHKGKEKYLATTQFEAPYARKAFPCFDEPGKKAEFKVSLLVDKNLMAVSNMPVKKEELNKKKKLVEFEKSPVMSTYLLYMGVGDFEFIEDRYENRVDLRVLTIPGKKSQGKFALDLTKKFLKYFEDYSGINYPLPKLDLLAIPDFAAGAMENWGAITFREILLLYSKGSSFKIKRRIAEVIAHELWHQWSGNLVTMKWWNDLWLNESFATYMAYKAMYHYFPEWNIWEYYIEADTAGALDYDSMKTTHPISVKVNSPREVEEIFDSISYGKGGSVLRMLDSFLGEENFRKGVSSYLNKFKYRNAYSEDFWKCLSSNSSISVKEIADSWINQPGYPLIKIKNRGKYVVVEQEPFQEAFKGQLWTIPLTISTESKNINILFRGKKQKIFLPEGYLKFNKDQSGFFRIKYPIDKLEKIKDSIKQNKFSSLDLYGLENDLFYLALYGKISVDHYLNFIRAYENKNDYLVLSDIRANLSLINYTFSNLVYWDKISSKFKTHYEPLFLKSFLELGWQPKAKDSVNESLLRPISISYLSFAENEKIISEGMKKFDKHHPDTMSVVYGLIAKNGGKNEHEKILKKYKNTKLIEEKVSLLSSLYLFRDKDLLKKSLDFAISGEVKFQDIIYAFKSITYNPTARGFFLDYTKENWNEFLKHKDRFFIFSTFLETLVISSMNNLEEVSDLIKREKLEYKKTLSTSFDLANVYRNFSFKNRLIMEKYFS